MASDDFKLWFIGLLGRIGDSLFEFHLEKNSSGTIYVPLFTEREKMDEYIKAISLFAPECGYVQSIKGFDEMIEHLTDNLGRPVKFAAINPPPGRRIGNPHPVADLRSLIISQLDSPVGE